jgi:outer membrane receptor protein involved in Fe transport
LLLGSAVVALCPATVLAQDATTPPSVASEDVGGGGASTSTTEEAAQDVHDTTTRRGDEYHAPEEQAIVVTGFVHNRQDLLSGTSVLSGEELTRELRPTIGDTLSRLPGVSATSFGPNASRPVLRGFQGERVLILTDGIGSLDVSNTSADHAVSINPLTADRMEVLRGPSALLFGSSAIGGVVNVVDSRIPRRVPEEAVHAEGILTYGSAANEGTVNGAIDVPVSGQFVVHLDANYTNTDDLEIGGFVLTPELRAEAAASADPAIRELAELRGRLPNSASETSEIAGGLAWIDGDNNLGVSLSRYDSLYGVPIRYSLDPASPAEEERLDLKQTSRGRPRRDRYRRRFHRLAALSRRLFRISPFRARGDGRDRDDLRERGRGSPARGDPVHARRLGRRLRRAIFRAQPQCRRRGEISTCQPHKPARPVRAADAELRQCEGGGRRALRA